jgi:DnaK suppressor protein
VDKSLSSGASGFVSAVLTIEKKAYLKKLLSQRLDELLTETGETARGMMNFGNQSSDLLDRASIESLTSFAFRIKGRDRILIRKIEYALSKLEDGTFGICEECGEEISEGRLQARPVATLCIKCKEKEETEERIREWKEGGDRFGGV